jgi:UDP-GlcNAc:undecaprenyl-phosphate GlcNAc-1-phosphate transferase
LDFADYLIFILGATLPSFALAWAFGYVVRRNAPRWGLVDQPSAAHKAHATPTPLGGGLAIAGAVVLSFALGQSLLFYLAAAPHADWLDLPDWIARHVSGLMQRAAQLWILLAAAVTLAVLGLADDRFRLPWAVRLVLQTIVDARRRAAHSARSANRRAAAFHSRFSARARRIAHRLPAAQPPAGTAVHG